MFVSKKRKPLKETKLGQFVAEKFPDLKDFLVDILPDEGGLGILKNILDRKEMNAQDRIEFERLWKEERIALEEEVTKRWQADSASESWLTRNIRPLIVGYLTLAVSIVAVCDSSIPAFEVPERWIILLESAWLTSLGGYFMLRFAEKRNRNKYLGER